MIKALISGFRSLQTHWRLIFIFWLVNLLIAKLSLIPLFEILDSFFGNRLPMEAADSTLSVSNWVDLNFATVDPQAIAFGGMKIWVLVAFLLALFLSAGAFSTLGNKRYESQRFWGDSGSWFFPFLRLSLWSVLPLIILLLPAGIPLLVKQSMGDDIPQDVLVKIILWVLVLGGIGFFLWRMVFDYARAWAVTMNLRATRKAVYRATVFVFKKIPVTFSFALAVALLHLAAIFFSHRLTGWANATWPETGTVGSIIGQLSIAVVIVFRLVRYRGVQTILNLYGVEPSTATVDVENPTETSDSSPDRSFEVLSNTEEATSNPLSSTHERELQQLASETLAETEGLQDPSGRNENDENDENDENRPDDSSDSTTEKIKSGDVDSDLATYLDNLEKE